MPIETKFLSYDTGKTYTLSPVVEGAPHRFIDQSTRIASYIIAICHDEEIGGEIHVVEEGQLFGPNSSTARIGQQTLRKILLPGFRYEEDIVDFEGDRGRLVLQHIGPGGLIQSYN